MFKKNDQGELGIVWITFPKTKYKSTHRKEALWLIFVTMGECSIHYSEWIATLWWNLIKPAVKKHTNPLQFLQPNFTFVLPFMFCHHYTYRLSPLKTHYALCFLISLLKNTCFQKLDVQSGLDRLWYFLSSCRVLVQVCAVDQTKFRLSIIHSCIGCVTDPKCI